MRATTWRRVLIKSCLPPLAALVAAAIMLAGCSAVPVENSTEPAPPANYGKTIADALKKFKDFANYRDFQISSLRWVHAATGWNWLVCVRYNDRGLTRFYAFFLDGDSVVNARYDVRTDHCAVQQYAPFDVMGGPGTQQPIY